MQKIVEELLDPESFSQQHCMKSGFSIRNNIALKISNHFKTFPSLYGHKQKMSHQVDNLKDSQLQISICANRIV